MLIMRCLRLHPFLAQSSYVSPGHLETACVTLAENQFHPVEKVFETGGGGVGCLCGNRKMELSGNFVFSLPMLHKSGSEIKE